MWKREKYLVKFNRKGKKSSLSLWWWYIHGTNIHGTLRKYLKLNFLVHGNGCKEICCLMPKVFHRNSTESDQLHSTLTCSPSKEILIFFLYCHTSLMHGFRFLPCPAQEVLLLACTPTASHLHLQNLFFHLLGITTLLLLTHILIHSRMSALACGC